MTPQFTRNPQQVEIRQLSPMLPLILATVSLIATVNPASPATAAECQVTDPADGGTPQGMTTWKGITLNIPPFTMTVERDIYREFISSPLPEVAPYMNSSRIAWGNTENKAATTSDTCWNQSARKSALFNQAMIRSIVKIPAKGHTQFMRFPDLSYNGKRQVLKTRTTLPEIEISPRYNTSTVIGPVQEIQKPGLSNDRTVSQAGATLPYTVQSLSLLGRRPLAASNPFQSALQLPVNESLRMNLTTTQALHGGNCADGCP